MKKVIEILQDRKKAIEIQLGDFPLNGDAYIMGIVANQLDEINEIEQAIEIIIKFNKDKR
jgi:hypothetical protein